jgi:hypothetical protein
MNTFWDMTLYNPVEVYVRFGGEYFHHLAFLACSSILKIEGVSPCEISIKYTGLPCVKSQEEIYVLS